MKFCRDCRFYSENYCFSANTAVVDRIRGPRAEWADHARNYVCGREDPKFFEPRLLARTITAVKGLLHRAAA